VRRCASSDVDAGVERRLLVVVPPASASCGGAGVRGLRAGVRELCAGVWELCAGVQ